MGKVAAFLDARKLCNLRRPRPLLLEPLLLTVRTLIVVFYISIRHQREVTGRERGGVGFVHLWEEINRKKKHC